MGEMLRFVVCRWDWAEVVGALWVPRSGASQWEVLVLMGYVLFGVCVA